MLNKIIFSLLLTTGLPLSAQAHSPAEHQDAVSDVFPIDIVEYDGKVKNRLSVVVAREGSHDIDEQNLWTADLDWFDPSAVILYALDDLVRCEFDIRDLDPDDAKVFVASVAADAATIVGGFRSMPEHVVVEGLEVDERDGSVHIWGVDPKGQDVEMTVRYGLGR